MRWHGLLAAALLVLASCSEAGPKTYEVSGKVTWNGQPLPEGSINFAAADGAPIEDQGKIIAGEYRLRAKPGKKVIRILADRGTGKIDPVMSQEVREQYIPDRYNTNSILSAEVTADGKNQFDFPLTDKR